MTEKPGDTQGTEKEQGESRDESPLEQLLYLALGTALAAKKRIESDSAQFREFQQQAQDNARTLLKGLSSRGEEGRDSARDTARDALRTLLREVIDDLGLATKKDLEQLKKDLER
ncbi:MAG: hypothetical protein RBR43_09030 [Desulfuromonadaceae bacterium]|nr:hypothetical protein [Desulfuromonadaceae bacterium]